MDSPAELARKMAVLETELARQRAAIERLTERAQPAPSDTGPAPALPLLPRLQTGRS